MCPDAGPNMAGKSTVLRMTCAVALLGASGLLAPAASASIPYIDAFMLRNFSADSPIEGRSSFMVEMLEMRCALPPSRTCKPLPCRMPITSLLPRQRSNHGSERDRRIS